jgi:hypothetical protein
MEETLEILSLGFLYELDWRRFCQNIYAADDISVRRSRYFISRDGARKKQTLRILSPIYFFDRLYFDFESRISRLQN